MVFSNNLNLKKPHVTESWKALLVKVLILRFLELPVSPTRQPLFHWRWMRQLPLEAFG